MIVSFTAMNKAIGTEAADMPHVLGDPADALWQGTAERTNANFAALTTYASAQIVAMNALRIPSAELSGTNVIAPSTGWATTGYARTFTVTGGKIVFLNLVASYSGTGYWGGDEGIYSPAVTIGTLAAALRPVMTYYFWRPYGASFMKSSIPDYVAQTHAGAGFGLSTAGVLTLTRSSSFYNVWWEKGGSIQLDYVYYTGA